MPRPVSLVVDGRCSMTSKVVPFTGKPKPPNAGKGRKKGVPNKTTASVKEALSMAFHGIGGVNELIEWGKANKTEFYKLWSKMLPQDLNVTSNPKEIEDAVDAELRRLIG